METTALTAVKSMLGNDNVKKRFNDVLGAKSGQYMASIVNVVSASQQLKRCDASSILSAAFVAASFDLPIDPNLGFAAIVPYEKSMKNEAGRWEKVPCAQFQMMYKGYIQLAIRSGEYERMNVSEVYADEIQEYNPITGDIRFVDDFSKTTMRSEGNQDNIVGYYAWFKLLSGYRQQLYMTKKDVENHAKKYSASYRYDLNSDKKSSNWSTNFDAMAKKTVIKTLLSKWGILSIDMQKAVIDDQKVYDENGIGEYGDNKVSTEETDVIEGKFKHQEIPQKPDPVPETVNQTEDEIPFA